MKTETTPARNILEATSLMKSYYLKNKGQQILILRGINLTMRRGEKVVISGKSGAGKSTLLNLLAGLEPPTSGEIVFDGAKVNRTSQTDDELAAVRRNKIGIVFQNFNLLPSWSACENVEAALFFTGMTREARKKRAVDLLTRVGLGDRLENLPSELSVGQQQRVAVARALVNDPEMIFADEPTGDVDRETAEEILQILFSWVADKKATLLVVTHGEFPLDRADRSLFLKDGVLQQHP